MGEWDIPQKTSQGLRLLEELDGNVCTAFCETAVEFIRNGFNPKVYTSAAQKLDIPIETVQQSLEALVQVLNEAVRTKTSEDEFEEKLEKYCGPLRSEVMVGLREGHAKTAGILLNHLARIVPSPCPRYKDLEWRFDVDIGSRACRDLFEPVVTLRLRTEEGGEEKEELFEVDPQTLQQLTAELEKASSELRSREYRKIRNQLK